MLVRISLLYKYKKLTSNEISFIISYILNIVPFFYISITIYILILSNYNVVCILVKKYFLIPYVPTPTIESIVVVAMKYVNALPVAIESATGA